VKAAPLCFVVIPFGVKADGRGGSVDFDAVYERLLARAGVEKELGRLKNLEAVCSSISCSPTRATGAWEDVTRLVDTMPVRRTLLVREQYGFALNRAGRSQDAERVLEGVLEDHGTSTETLGLLGRMYKDRWEAERGDSILKAQGQLDKAIEAYRRGFEAGWRDAYPGVNAVTLMEIREPGGEEQRALVPVVRYANRRCIESGAPDYWDHATRLELGVVGRDRAMTLLVTARA
jgi:hypothetical protein